MPGPEVGLGAETASRAAAAPGPLLVLVTAAGSSQRFGGGKKEFRELGGRSVLDRALSPFLELPSLAFLCLTAPAEALEETRAALSAPTLAALGERLLIVAGGPSRRDSVRLGLEALASAVERTKLRDTLVLIHDGARPWASPALAARVLVATLEFGAALPLLPLTETPKAIDPEGRVLGHPPRASLGAAQTPQGFRFEPILAAHRRALAEGFECTDDAELWGSYVGELHWVLGERENRKITFMDDLENAPASGQARLSTNQASAFRIGEGWDLHRLVPGRPLRIGGLSIAADFGEEAHSDGDVLLHAIIDALLGAAALGDIGTHFPPTEEAWRGADSRQLAATGIKLVREAGWEPVNLDCTVILERPKLGPYKAAIRAEIARILGLAEGGVSVKAKTSEGVDAVGEGRAIEARAIVLLRRA